MATPQTQTPPDGTGLIAHDPWLAPHVNNLQRRFAHYQSALAKIDQAGGLLGPVSQGHHYFGLNRREQHGQPGVWYREWAPTARLVKLNSDYNNWDSGSHSMLRDEYGVWRIFLPDVQY